MIDWRFYLFVCLDPAALKAAMPTDEETGEKLFPWNGRVTPFVRAGHYETKQDEYGNDVKVYVRDQGIPGVIGIVAWDGEDVDGLAAIKQHCTLKRMSMANALILQQQFPQFKFKELGTFARIEIPDTALPYPGDE